MNVKSTAAPGPWEPCHSAMTRIDTGRPTLCPVFADDSLPEQAKFPTNGTASTEEPRFSAAFLPHTPLAWRVQIPMSVRSSPMRNRHGYEEPPLNCGICVEPLAWEHRSSQNPSVHAKCWNATHQQSRGWRRSFLDGRGALTSRAEGDTTHG